MASTPDVPLQTRIIDDKSTKCVPFILERLQAYQASPSAANSPCPFIIGLNGVQGVGKTTLVRALAETLQQRQNLQTLVLSIDDFYLRHADQLRLAAAHPDNALVQVRGEPGTHDVALLRNVFHSLSTGQPTLIPAYDKGAYNGLGDRLPESQWTRVNHEGQPRVQVVILEGWCVGFRGISHEEIEAKWLAPSRTLALHQLEDLYFINDQLKGYDVVTDLLDAFIHIDAEDIEYVYGWRLEQEQVLRRERGIGMTDEQVVRFVDAYYPAYELFSDGVRSGIFRDRKGCQLRLIVDKYRMVADTIII